MGVVFFPEQLLAGALVAAAAGCVSSPPELPPGVGFDDVYREVSVAGGRLASSSLRVGPWRIPLGGPAFRLWLEPGGELSDEAFDVVESRGLGGPRAWIRFLGREVPLEVEVELRARLDGPVFEKSLGLRWVGPPGQAPRLERAVVEEFPAGGYREGGPGRPLFLAGCFLAVAAPWGGTAAADGWVRAEVAPCLSLAGGWWFSPPAVLGPAGQAEPELAFLRWLARRRGRLDLRLLALGADEEGELPGAVAGVPLHPVRASAAASSRPGAAPAMAPPVPEGALEIGFPEGIRAEDPDFRKSIQAAAGDRGPCLLAGLDPESDPLALRDAVDLLRLGHGDREVHVAWTGGPAPSPLWQLLLAGQEGPLAGKGGPWLGQALSRVRPWRQRGEAWSRELADRLLLDLAAGSRLVNLGYLPPAGEARRFLEEALAWARLRGGLLASSRAVGDSWLARDEGGVLVTGTGAAAVGGLLPADRPWGEVALVYPERRRLGPEARVGPGTWVVQAWPGRAEAPGWVRGEAAPPGAVPPAPPPRR